jgi:peptide/nickel transport system permease protein
MATSATVKQWLRASRFNLILGLAILTALALVALLAPWIAPQNPYHIDYTAIAQGASANHVLGTDSIGRDLLSRLMIGSRVSLLVGFLAVAVATVIGVPLGLMIGYAGGWVDEIVSRVIDVVLAFPTFLLAIAIVAILGPGTRNVIIALGLTGWTEFCRVTRAEVIAKKELDYVEAAKASGIRSLRLLFVHLMPNIVPPLIVLATLRVGTAIVAEAGLSFLGLGVQPPDASWGTILSDGRSYLYHAAHIMTFAGLAIMITVLAINLIGDHLRDQMDVSRANA